MFEFTIPASSAPQRPKLFVLSVAIHSLAIVLLLAIRFSGAVSNLHFRERVTVIAPVSELPVLRPKVSAPRLREFRAPPVLQAHLELPAAPVISAPMIETPRPILPELPNAPAPKAVSVPEIKINVFSEVKTAPVSAPKPVVRASGFESAESSNHGPARGKVSAVGSFDSAAAAEGAPARGPSSTARSSGFSDAAAGSSGGAIARGSVKTAMFGDTTVSQNAAAKRITTAATSTSIEILSKPKPAYTDEARAMKIEGEVLIEMQFSASGEARVLRVIRGLGHGLDETAAAAARAIRFRPATRDGAAIDSAATVHILFQLAN